MQKTRVAVNVLVGGTYWYASVFSTCCDSDKFDLDTDDQRITVICLQLMMLHSDVTIEQSAHVTHESHDVHRKTVSGRVLRRDTYWSTKAC